MTRSRGFTLPELLVTLTVLATASTLAIPAYRDWQSRIELQEAQRERERHNARWQAFVQRGPVEVSLAGESPSI